MKQLSQLPAEVVKEVSASKPFGAIINETNTQDGTPVIREIYNDIIINHYKTLQLAGITPDGTEDGEIDGIGGVPKYQLVEAIRKLPNLLNGIEQVLSFSVGVWSIPVNLDLLPDKYIFICRATEDYTSGTFKGTTGTVYTFTSPGFLASDEVLVIVDQSQVRAYSLTPQTDPGYNVDIVYTQMGLPLGYNDNETLYYQESGALLTDLPSASYIEDVLRTDLANIEISLLEMFIYQNYLLCVVFDPSVETYLFRQFTLADLSESDPVALSGATIPTGSDFEPYFYSDGENVYITNEHGTTNIDNDVSVFAYNPGIANLVFQATISLDVTFVKTTNAALKDKKLYVLSEGNLRSHDVNTSAVVNLGTFTGTTGTLFNYLGNIYHATGEIARKWV